MIYSIVWSGQRMKSINVKITNTSEHLWSKQFIHVYAFNLNSVTTGNIAHTYVSMHCAIIDHNSTYIKHVYKIRKTYVIGCKSDLLRCVEFKRKWVLCNLLVITVGVLNSYDWLRCEFPRKQVMCDLLIIIMCVMNDCHGRSLRKSIGRATETSAYP